MNLIVSIFFLVFFEVLFSALFGWQGVFAGLLFWVYASRPIKAGGKWAWQKTNR